MVLFICQFSTVCNFGKFYNFVFETLGGGRVNQGVHDPMKSPLKATKPTLNA